MSDARRRYLIVRPHVRGGVQVRGYGASRPAAVPPPGGVPEDRRARETFVDRLLAALPTSSRTMVKRAYRAAEDAHRGQQRKGINAPPYIVHPVAVAAELVAAGVRDPAALSAAFLHDAVEDTSMTIDDVRSQFGSRTAALVAEVTDPPAPREERRAAQLASARDWTEHAANVKTGDKISNVWDMLNAPPDGMSDEARRQYIEFSTAVVRAAKRAHPALRKRYMALARRADL